MAISPELMTIRAVTGSVWNNPAMSGLVLMLRKVPSCPVTALSRFALEMINRIID